MITPTLALAAATITGPGPLARPVPPTVAFQRAEPGAWAVYERGVRQYWTAKYLRDVDRRPEARP